MGQTLSEPVVKKWSFYGEDERMIFGASEMQGWRLTMEDEHALILDLDAVPGTAETAQPERGDSRDGVPKDGEVTSQPEELANAEVLKSTTDGGKGKEKKNKRSFFAVYDGHGGTSTARQAGRTVHHRLRETEEYKKGDYVPALKSAFLRTDEALKASPEFWNDPSGCTAVAALVTEDNRIIVANAGDSRSVMSVGGKVKELSFDHKPMNYEENARITKAGGFVEFGRVNGNLALSRALGDFEFKRNDSLPAEEQIVTCDPDITIHESTPEDEFLILACDGIWDVVSSQRAVDLVRKRIAAGVKLDAICEDLMDRCLAPDSDCGGIGCDNMTLVVVALLGGRTKDEWYAWVKDRVDNNIGYSTPAEWPGLAASVDREGGAGGAGFRAGPLGGLGGLGAGRFLLGPGGPRILAGMSAGDGDDDDDLDGEDDGRLTALRALQKALRGPTLEDTSDEEEDEDAMDEDGQAKNHVQEIQVDDDEATPQVPTPAPSTFLPGANKATNAEVPAPAVKVEGLSDKSEDPLKQAASDAAPTKLS